MSYGLETITTTTDVDGLINMAEWDKRTLMNRKETLEIRGKSTANTTAEHSSDLADAQAALAASISYIAGLTEGYRKETEIIKKMDLETKVAKLTLATKKLSQFDVVQMAYDADLLEKRIAGVEAFIVAANARKTELAA